jgi:hypothetical protein
MRKHIFARFALVLAGLLFAALPSFAQAIWVNTPIHTNQPFNRALPMQTWECSGPQATLGTDMVEFLDTDGTVNGYVDCHGNIVGAGSTTSWSAITNPTANLVLSMGTYNTAFEASGNSGFAWTWPSSDAAVPGGLAIANTTAATNFSARSSPAFGFEASYWDGSAAQMDTWTINSLTSSSTNSDLILAYTGSAPVYSLAVPGLVASKLVDFSGATGLNLPATITAATPTTDLSVGTGTFRFDFTSSGGGVSFINQTAASSSLNQWSPQFVFGGQYWNGTASAADLWNYETQLGTGANPTTTLIFRHSGSTGAAYAQFPNIETPGLANFSGASDLYTPTGAGAAGTVAGDLKFDSTNLNYHGFTGQDSIVAVFPATTNPTTSDCVKWAVVSGQIYLADTGAACGGATLWNNIGNPAGDKTFSMTAYSTDFSYTSSGEFRWDDTNPATNVAANPTPSLLLSGNYWNGAASATDLWTIFGNIGNGTNGDSTFELLHAGSTGAPSVQVPGLSSPTRLVSALPTASTHATYSYWVSDSTTIVTEGQTCAGSGGATALAISNGTIWKCF